MNKPELIIEPNKSIKNFWKEIWHFRDLFYFLAWRDIIVRYKQTVIGVTWSLLRPLLTMLVFTIVFGRIARLPSDGTPYAILVFTALLPWQFFSNTFVESSNSLIANNTLISKVYFPRIIIPTTAMVVSLIDFAIAFCLLIIMMIYYGLIPDSRILLLPFLLLIATLTSLGAGYMVSALNVKYRDFRYVVPFLVQFGLYISPVGFSSSVVPDNWRLFYSLNPMVGVIDGFRWALTGSDVYIYWPGFLISLLFSVSLFISGILYFNKTERSFADII